MRDSRSTFFRTDVTDLRKTGPWSYGTLAVMAVVLGGLAFTNMWDLPTYAALLVGIAALKAYPGKWSEGGVREDIGAVLRRVGIAVIQAPLIVVALAFALYLPYYLEFTSSVQGIGAVTTPSRYFHLFLVWGTLLVFVAPFIVVCFWQTVVGPDWRRMTVFSLAIAFLPFLLWLVVRLQSPTPTEGPLGRLIHILPLALLIGMAVWSAIHETRLRGPTGRGFALALAALGLILIMGPELMYVDDFFDDPRQRMNTVFKLYYQAWVMLAAVSGYSIYYWLSMRPRLTGRKSEAVHGMGDCSRSSRGMRTVLPGRCCCHKGRGRRIRLQPDAERSCIRTQQPSSRVRRHRVHQGQPSRGCRHSGVGWRVVRGRTDLPEHRRADRVQLARTRNPVERLDRNHR